MKALVVQTAYLGDVILTVPMLDLLRDEVGVTDLAVLAAPAGAAFLRTQMPGRDVILYDKRGRDGGIGGIRRIVLELRERRFDLAVVPHRSFRSAMVAALAGASERIGFDESGGRFLLTATVPYRKHGHEVERIASLLDGLRKERVRDEIPLALRVSDEARSRLRERLGRHLVGTSGYVVIAPGSRWATKQWIPARFAEVGDRLARERGALVVLTGGADDRQVSAEVAALASVPPLDFTGTLEMGEWLALLEGALLVVSNDSAAAHAAAGCNTPVVAIFGPTVPAQGFAPRGGRVRIVECEMPCRPCGRHGGRLCPAGTLACMEGVEPEDVLRAGREIARVG